MKFDVVIGNPPYQKDVEGTSAKQIYPEFMDAAYSVGAMTCLITPARFLFNAGKTSKTWNQKMLNSENLKVLEYVQNSGQVFENTDIQGGIAVTYYDESKEFNPIGIFMPFDILRDIVNKVILKSNISIQDIAYSSMAYKFTNEMHNDYPDVFDMLSKGNEYDLTTNILDKLPQIFHENIPLDNFEYIQIYGRMKNGNRVYRWVNSEYIKTINNFDKHKVLLPASNGSGAIGEVSSTPLIGQPLTVLPLVGHTQTFMSFGSFNTELEATACLKYIKSKFARVMLGVLKVTQHNPIHTWAKVPLQDFTAQSDIDWTQSISQIDQQLYKKYNLNEEEINFIESHVKEMN